MNQSEKLANAKLNFENSWERLVDQAAEYIEELHHSIPPNFYKEVTDLFLHFQIRYFLQPANEAKGYRNFYIEHKTVPKGLRPRTYTLPGVIVSIDSDKMDELIETKIANEITGLNISQNYNNYQASKNIELNQDFDSLEKLIFKGFKEININKIYPYLKSIDTDIAHLDKLKVPIAPALEVISLGWGNPSYSNPHLIIPKHTKLYGIPLHSIIERYEQ